MYRFLASVLNSRTWLSVHVIVIRSEWSMTRIQPLIEPSHEIMALFDFRKLIFQTRMRSHQVGLFVWFLVGPFFMCANSEGSNETTRMRRLAWAFAGRLWENWTENAPLLLHLVRPRFTFVQIYLRMYSRSHAHFHRSAIHMRKIHIYVNLLTYVYKKNATSKVALCSHEFYRQVNFSVNTSHFLILIK